jgi:hypothetical protein
MAPHLKCQFVYEFYPFRASGSMYLLSLEIDMTINSLEQLQPAEALRSAGGETAIGKAAGEAYTVSGQAALRAASLNNGDSATASLPDITIHDDTGTNSSTKGTGSDTVTQQDIDNYFTQLTGKPVHGNDPSLVERMNENPGSTLAARPIDDQPGTPTTTTTNDNPSQHWTQQDVNNYFSQLTGKPENGNDPALVNELNEHPGWVLGAQTREDQPNDSPPISDNPSQQAPSTTQQEIDNYFSELTGKPVQGNDPSLVERMDEHPDWALSAAPQSDEKVSGQPNHNNQQGALIGF